MRHLMARWRRAAGVDRATTAPTVPPDQVEALAFAWLAAAASWPAGEPATCRR
jgi:1,6-anhydro-N-acetylmuramate kinase